jgi:hypothetical protein
MFYKQRFQKFNSQLFLKLVHTEAQVNYKTQPIWVKVVHLVPDDHTLAGHVIFGTNGYPPFQNQVHIYSGIGFFIGKSKGMHSHPCVALLFTLYLFSPMYIQLI